MITTLGKSICFSQKYDPDDYANSDYDYYPTPPELVFNLLEILSLEFKSKIRNSTILEPCAGTRDLLIPLAKSFPLATFLHSDIQDKPFSSSNDSSVIDYYRKISYDWLITNPPFNRSSLILKHGFEECKKGVIALLRLSWVEPCRNRRAFLINNADHLRFFIPVSPRPRFKGKGNDNVTCAWFIWEKEFSWEEEGIECPFNFLLDWKLLATPKYLKEVAGCVSTTSS